MSNNILATRVNSTSMRLNAPSMESITLMVPVHTTGFSAMLMHDLITEYQRYAVPLIQYMLMDRSDDGLTAFDALDIMAVHLSNVQKNEILDLVRVRVREQLDWSNYLPVAITARVYGKIVDQFLHEKAVTYGYKCSISELTGFAAPAPTVAQITAQAPAPAVTEETKVAGAQAVMIEGKEVLINHRIDENTATYEQLIAQALRVIQLAGLRDEAAPERNMLSLISAVLSEGGSVKKVVEEALLAGDYDVSILELLVRTPEGQRCSKDTLRTMSDGSGVQLNVPTFLKSHAKALLIAKGQINMDTDVINYLKTNPQAFEQIREELSGIANGGRVELKDVVDPANPDREISYQELHNILAIHGVDSGLKIAKADNNAVAAQGASAGAFAQPAQPAASTAAVAVKVGKPAKGTKPAHGIPVGRRERA